MIKAKSSGQGYQSLSIFCKNHMIVKADHKLDFKDGVDPKGVQGRDK